MNRAEILRKAEAMGVKLTEFEIGLIQNHGKDLKDVVRDGREYR